ncbi:hypothetical protein HDU67_009412, partial [Dinochytrium kinnereticum]
MQQQQQLQHLPPSASSTVVYHWVEGATSLSERGQIGVFEYVSSPCCSPPLSVAGEAHPPLGGGSAADGAGRLPEHHQLTSLSDSRSRAERSDRDGACSGGAGGDGDGGVVVGVAMDKGRDEPWLGGCDEDAMWRSLISELASQSHSVEDLVTPAELLLM